MEDGVFNVSANTVPLIIVRDQTFQSDVHLLPVEQVCDLGEKKNTDGECLKCPKGEFNEIPDSPSCLKCPVQSSTPGEGARSKDECACIHPLMLQQRDRSCKCPNGTRNNAGLICELCQKGEYNEIPDSPSCLKCPRGKVVPYEGATANTQCVCQENKVLLANQDACGCIAGFKTGDGDSCEKCPESSYSDQSDSSVCQLCPGGSKAKSIGASDASQCFCDATYVDSTQYDNLQPLATSGVHTDCASCLSMQNRNASGDAVGLGTAVVCPGTPVDGRLFTSAGHWRNSSRSVNVYKCAQESHCKGAGINCTMTKLAEGSNVNVSCSSVDHGDESCAANRRGVLCWNCRAGFGGTSCISCDEMRGNSGLAITGGVVAAMLGLMYCQHCAKDPALPKTLTFLIDHAQLLSIISNIRLPWSCLQFNMFSVISMGELSLGVLFGSNCALGLNYFSKLILTAFSPAILIGLGSCGALLLRAIQSARSKPLIFTLKQELLQVVSVCVVLSHSSVTRFGFMFFAFVEIENRQLNVMDLSIDLASVEYKAHAWVACLMLIYCVAVPLLAAFAIWRIHKQDPGMLENTNSWVYHCF